VLFEQRRAHAGNPLFLAISLERNTPPHRWLGCWVVGVAGLAGWVGWVGWLGWLGWLGLLVAGYGSLVSIS